MTPLFSRRPSTGRTGSTLATLLAVAVLAGCASSVPLNDSKTPVESRTPAPVSAAPGSGANAGGSPQSAVATVDLSKQDAGKLARVVFFDYDSFVVKDEYRGALEGHAKQLAAAPAKRMVVEGHTDERGGREYNLALGQKRAEAVVKSLTLLGAGAGQVEAVSFGKERPAVQGSDEAAWAQNRRAELRDR